MFPVGVSIPDAQNSEQQLDRLAAQRVLYSRAKEVFVLAVILSVVGPFVGILLLLLLPELKAWVVLYGVTVTVLDIVLLDSWHRGFQRQAAGIQEAFDCDVLGIESDPIRKPEAEPEIIRAAAERYRKQDPAMDALRNWYPTQVAEIPRRLGRLLCQRTNLRWDGHLRRTYAKGLVVLVLVGCTFAAIAGLSGNLMAEELVLSVLAPMLPLITWGIREARRQNEAADDADRVQKHVESVWDRAIKGELHSELLDRESRLIQNEIYARRKRAPLVFDWVYRRLRSSYEADADAGMRCFIEQAKAAALS